ncbi:uncharacterized protein LOC122965521 isoform X2 [Thunnus albacares]|uniref:uncharacterized protein LOC122965521 isoform X2 n=1 Tax=Thunnus albacares TaxID=8236 RepID=UPI001CF64777|nr:uncharacterized protein LOC122965521 isoform X2 [Thunnus albacares]
MAEFRWIKMFSFLILELQITAVTGQFPSVIVRDGDDVTLPCENVTANQDKCDKSNWFYSSTGYSVDLVKCGQIHENTKVKSDRLSVTANCSLVIKKITPEDVGRYFCQQHISQQDSLVVLSVINMNKHEDSDYVTLSCFVWTHDQCRHRVKWLNEGHDVNEDVTISQIGCLDVVRFPASHLKLKSTYHEIFQCKVTDGYTNKEHLFTFSPPSSGDATPTTNDTPTKQQVWLRFIIMSVGLTALIVIVVSVNIWTRTKVNKSQMDDNAVHNDEDEGEGTVTYENDGEPSATVRLH